jgi:hypothetical protein
MLIWLAEKIKKLYGKSEYSTKDHFALQAVRRRVICCRTCSMASLTGIKAECFYASGNETLVKIYKDLENLSSLSMFT